MGALVGSVLVGVVVVFIGQSAQAGSDHLECKVLREYVRDMQEIVDGGYGLIYDAIEGDQGEVSETTEAQFDAAHLAISDHIRMDNKASLPSAKYMNALIAEKCAD